MVALSCHALRFFNIYTAESGKSQNHSGVRVSSLKPSEPGGEGEGI